MKYKYLAPSILAAAIMASGCAPSTADEDAYVIQSSEVAVQKDANQAGALQKELTAKDQSVKGVTVGKNDKGESVYMVTRQKEDGTTEVIETPPINQLNAQAQQQAAASGGGSSNGMITGMLLGHMMGGGFGGGNNQQSSGFTNRSFSSPAAASGFTNSAWQKQVSGHQTSARTSYSNSVAAAKASSSASTSRAAFSSGGRSSASSSSGG